MSLSLPSVDYTPSDEHSALTDAMRAFFRDRPPRPGVGSVEVDRPGWTELGKGLGVLGLEIPADAGGAGGTLADTAVVNVEAGRALSNLPLVPLAASATLLAAASDELLAPVLSGEVLVELVGLGPVTPDGRLTAVTDGDGVRLRGVHRPVPGGGGDVTLVIAGDAQCPLVAVVDASGEGHHVTRADSIDLTRPWSIHTFEDTPARVLLRGAEHASTVRLAVDRARVALAADQLGVAAAMLATTIEYARIRFQFGRAIGSQQAVKHRCVDMSIAVERATSALDFAARTTDGPAAAVAALTALIAAGVAAATVTTGSIQLLGGIGMTWEHVAHLYLRRSLASDALFGSASQNRRALSAVLWDGDVSA